MKRFFLLIFTFVFFFSCQKEYQPRTIDAISLQKYTIDSTSIRAIYAADSNSLYYVGSKGDIGKTTDGGKTWNKQFVTYQDSIVPHFRSMASNGSILYALSIGNPALLYQVNSGNPKIVYKEEHEKVFYDSMKFFDELNGIAMGDPTEDCLSIILTSDGGKTWRKIPCDKLPKTDDGEAAFAASNTNIAVLGETAWIVTGGTKARLFKTTDLGKTWSVFDTPIVQGDGPQGIYSVDFIDENNGIIFGGNYSKEEENTANKAVTIDGGKTWSLVANGQYPNYKSCVQYVPDTDGKEIFAVGKTGVSYSNDGGYTWKEVSKEGYYVIQFVDRNTAWLAGNQKIGKLTLQ
ncbi:oxidoreductase [Pseudotenacibaculum sp. MALMAid0570]|uniref:WD40/YVTN/BNR-like repeat-containing protein n=1 Tax=Pseudotenacibaculum sp. MALMAid0570 TaxID=3143938 RepID=UPI0032E022DA